MLRLVNYNNIINRLYNTYGVDLVKSNEFFDLVDTSKISCAEAIKAITLCAYQVQDVINKDTVLDPRENVSKLSELLNDVYTTYVSLQIQDNEFDFYYNLSRSFISQFYYFNTANEWVAFSKRLGIRDRSIDKYIEAGIINLKNNIDNLSILQKQNTDNIILGQILRYEIEQAYQTLRSYMGSYLEDTKVLFDHPILLADNLSDPGLWKVLSLNLTNFVVSEISK